MTTDDDEIFDAGRDRLLGEAWAERDALREEVERLRAERKQLLSVACDIGAAAAKRLVAVRAERNRLSEALAAARDASSAAALELTAVKAERDRLRAVLEDTQENIAMVTYPFGCASPYMESEALAILAALRAKAGLPCAPESLQEEVERLRVVESTLRMERDLFVRKNDEAKEERDRLRAEIRQGAEALRPFGGGDLLTGVKQIQSSLEFEIDEHQRHHDSESLLIAERDRLRAVLTEIHGEFRRWFGGHPLQNEIWEADSRQANDFDHYLRAKAGIP